jgi:predicted nucleic acid-binding protein
VILLDTNVVSEPLRPQPDGAVLAWLDRQLAETLYLTAISLSELLLGVERLPAGRRRNALANGLRVQITTMFGHRILPFDADAAEAYARLVSGARRRGQGISITDAQIAAIAASRSLSVATRDEAPFRAVGVAVINPWAAGA